MRAERLRQPHGDEGERLAVGEVEPGDAQHLGVGRQPEHLRDLGRRGLEAELENPPLRAGAGGLERGLDGGDASERLTYRVAPGR